MWKRDADLVVDVLHEPRAVEAAGAGTAPHVRRAEVLHRDADDATVLRGGWRGINASAVLESPESRADENSSVVLSAVWIRAAAAERCCAARRARASAWSCAWRRASSAWSCLISVWMPASIRSALRELALDRCLLARSLGHDPGLCDAGALQLRPPCLDFLAELLDVAEHLRVLVADALHHVEPAEEVVEVLRPEDDLDRTAAVAVDVERAQPLRDVHLCGAEALLRDDEVAGIRVELRVDLRELRRSRSCTTRSPSRAGSPTG